ncbi:MAG: hypothetical protein MK191_07490, partial [Acidimicrobiales bacterium]|nr:hypothetical protein [Acidimicrobiales bacterium]
RLRRSPPRRSTPFLLPLGLRWMACRGMGMGGMGMGPWRGDLLDEASKILDDLFEDLFQEASEDLADLFEEPVADLEGLLEDAAE